MVRYRRNFVPGGTYFFTVTLADRISSVLVDQLSALRMAFRIARHERPFTIEAERCGGPVVHHFALSDLAAFAG
jgi:putative transposase